MIYFFCNFSGKQLHETSQKLESFVINSRGNKQNEKCDKSVQNDNCEDNKSIEYLKNLLSIERVALANKKAKGIYEPDENRVKVTKVIGKFNFGFSDNNQMYLKLHEALLLIEMVCYQNNIILFKIKSF
jgi:tRNA-splicing endonuclease subunit sen54 N-term